MDDIDRRLAEPWPCTADGWTVGGYARPIWTPCGFLRRGQGFRLRCRGACKRIADAPLQALVDAGMGDRRMHTFRWRCGVCQSADVAIEIDETVEPK